MFPYTGKFHSGDGAPAPAPAPPVGVPIQSLAVVGKSHKEWAEVSQHVKPSKDNGNYCPLDDSEFSNDLASKAVLVNHRPLLGNSGATTVVLWRSDVVHCGGVEKRNTRKGKQADGFFPPVSDEGHFKESQTEQWLEYMEENGWVVVEFEEENDHTTLATQRLREALIRMNKEDSIPEMLTHPLYGLTEKEFPPFKSMGIRQWYGIAQTLYADHLRLASKPLFEVVYGTEDLTCSLDACAIGIDVRKHKGHNWLHVDKHPENKSYCVQATICVHTAGTDQFARIGQYACWMPLKDREGGARERMGEIRKKATVSTHLATLGFEKPNIKAVPTFQPGPKENLQVVYPPEKDDLFELLVPPAPADVSGGGLTTGKIDLFSIYVLNCKNLF